MVSDTGGSVCSPRLKWTRSLRQPRPWRLLSGCLVALKMLSTHCWAHCAVNETTDLTKVLPDYRFRPPWRASDEADNFSISSLLFPSLHNWPEFVTNKTSNCWLLSLLRSDVSGKCHRSLNCRRPLRRFEICAKCFDLVPPVSKLAQQELPIFDTHLWRLSLSHRGSRHWNKMMYFSYEDFF